MKLKTLFAAMVVTGALAAPAIGSAAVYHQSVLYQWVPADPVPLEDQGLTVIHDTYLVDGTHINLWDDGQGNALWTDDAENKLSFGLFRSREIVEYQRKLVHGHYVLAQRVGPDYVNGVHQGLYSVKDVRKNVSAAVKPRFRKSLAAVTRTFNGQSSGSPLGNSARNTQQSRAISQQPQVVQHRGPNQAQGQVQSEGNNGTNQKKKPQ